MPGPEEITSRLERAGIDYCIVGGLASIACGQPTEDGHRRSGQILQQRTVHAIAAEAGPGRAKAAPLNGRRRVRAQAMLPDGTLVQDFQLVRAENALHVLNAPSPAATASLAIGEHLASRLHREATELVC